MTDPQSRRYSSGEVSDIIRTAFEYKSGSEDLSYGDLLEIAGQAGLSPGQIESAIEYSKKGKSSSRRRNVRAFLRTCESISL